MDLIDKLSKYAQEDGLPVGLLQVDKCLMNGSTGAREDIRQGAKTKKREPLWNDICTTLWGGGSEGTTAPGLLSGLGSAVSETKAKVVAALKLCDVARSTLDSFGGKCTRAKTPLQPSFADEVRAAWKMVNAAQIALEDAQSGTTSSIHTLLAHLDRRNNRQFQEFDQHAREVENAFDLISHERALFENDYEARRWGNMKHLELDGNEAWAKINTPHHMRTKVWPPGGSAIQVNYNEMAIIKRGDSINLILFGMSRDDPPAVLENNNVTFEQTTLRKFDDDRFISQFGAIAKRDFFRVWFRQEAILKALSKKDGLWNDENAVERSAQATVAFRERLNTTLDKLEDLAKGIKLFQSIIITPLVAAGQALAHDLHDLHANIFYGNAEDQQENIAETRKSLMEWFSVQHEASDKTESNTFEGLTGELSIGERFGILEIGKDKPVKQEMRSSVSPDLVIVAIDKMAQTRRNNLSVVAFFDSQSRTPKICDYSKNTNTSENQLLAARARLLELPRSQACESGEVSVNEPLAYNYVDDRARPMGCTSHQIKFKNGYSSKPVVVCWFSGMKAMTGSSDLLLRVDSENVSPDGFTLKISAKRNTIMNGNMDPLSIIALQVGAVIPTQLQVKITWFAYSPDHPHVTSGRSEFTKRGHHSLDGYMPSERVTFPQGMFEGRRPYVFAGYSLLEFNHQTDIRAEIIKSDVTTEGMKVALNAWSDTDCYMAGISWFAFDEKFYKYRVPE